MPDDNTIRFTFRTLDTNLQKIKYIAGVFADVDGIQTAWREFYKVR